MQPYRFIKAHPGLGIKLKIFYFALEESILEFMLVLICSRLQEVYGTIVQPMELMSMGTHTLSDDMLAKIQECKEYFKELEECIEVIDFVSNPYGCYKHVRAYARENGRFYYKGVEVNPETSVFDHYVANNPNEFVIGILDHVSLLSPENTPDTNTLHGAMSKFSSEYCRKMITKQFRYTWVNIQQQSADKEKLQFTSSGQNIEQKLKPSLEGLADSKVLGRDYMVLIGLFAPERYQISKDMGYDITVLKDNYRNLSIIKSRFGKPNLELGLYFDGATNTFEELPVPKSEEMKKIYEEIKRKRL